MCASTRVLAHPISIPCVLLCESLPLLLIERVWQLFIGAQNVWVFFVAYIWLKPEYHDMKLGSQTEEPEFSAVVW